MGSSTATTRILCHESLSANPPLGTDHHRPPQFFQNIAHMQPGQAGFRGANHAMTLASGPQAGQPGLGQANPAAQQQFLQQQSMQRLGLGMQQQQQQQQQQSQLASGNAPGMGALQHPGQPHLNNLASANNPALLSLINMGANGMGQQNNHLMNNLLRNNNMLDSNNLNRLDPLMNEQVSSACERSHRTSAEIATDLDDP